MRLVRLAIGLRLAIYAIVTLLAIAGLLAFTTLPQSVYPNLNISRVEVRAESTDLAPNLVQAALAHPLEREVQTLLGVQQVQALSTQGAADVQVTFDPQADINAAVQRTSTAVNRIQGSLPAGTAVTVQQVGTNLFPIVSYALTSRRLSLMQLREIAEYQIRPQLLGTPGVSFVNVSGGQVREYLVAVDPGRLASRGITLDDVERAIAQTNTVGAVGHTDEHYIRSAIIASGLAHNSSEIAGIPVATRSGIPVTVADVADVREASAPSIVRAGTWDSPAVLLSIFAQSGASFTGVANAASVKLDRVLSNFPDIRVTKYYDPASLVGSAIASLRDAIIIGLILSALVLLYFLRTVRSAIVAGAVIPLTIVIAFGFMHLMGQGLNLMTLGGLAVGVGLIIDDAIVVVENIDRHLADGGDRRHAVEAAVAEIAGPMTSSTLTTIVVFAPLSLLSGVPGAFFRALSGTLTVALLLSLVLAFAFTPNLALRFLRPSRGASGLQVERLVRPYINLLSRALANPKSVWIAAAGVVLATLLLATHLGTDFLPALDEGSFEMTYALPPGTTLAQTRGVTHQIERVLHDDAAVASSADLTGQSMTLENTDTPQGQNGATIRAILKPRNERAPMSDVIERLQRAISAIAPNVQLSTRQLLADMLSDLSNQAAPIEVRVFGPQESVLVPVATQVAARIATVPGVSGTFSGVVYHNPAVVVEARPAAAAFGVTPAEMLHAEQAMFGGAIVSSVIASPLTIPVRVRYDFPDDPSLAQVQNAPYVTPSGAVEPLSRLATFERIPPQNDVTELNGRQYIAVTAQISGSNLGAIVNGIKQRLAQISLPPGYYVEIAGSYALQRQAFTQFALTILLSIVLVFLVMLVQFRSFVQPLVIVAAIPLSLFGASLLLFVTRITLNVSTLMGVILLVGLVVKNGILLLEYTVRRERQGWEIAPALIDAARVRFRPIVMTTLTALLGMLPLALALGSGGELLQPLAVAVIGGLLFSTAFTLVMIPVFYETFAARASTRVRAVAVSEQTKHA
ncbi:MAG: efflux RND transporter permease subunit [Vulcanimicrobiaceae bacterium]